MVSLNDWSKFNKRCTAKYIQYSPQLAEVDNWTAVLLNSISAVNLNLK